MASPWLREFRTPGPQYRGAPFWSWNGPLEADELRRQIRTLGRMGFGGFFMHSRVGLHTPYLSDEWMRLVGACVDEARRCGLRAWLYDEDRWPSGAAGGLVTRERQHRMRSLVMTQHDGAAGRRAGRAARRSLTDEPPAPLARFAAKLRDGVIQSTRRLPESAGQRQSSPGRLQPGETLLTFHVEEQQPSDWFNGQTYLDTLSHDAVRAFIRTTHEAYRRHFADHFAQLIPGIFTDEPNTGGLCRTIDARRTATAWTGRLTATFKRRYGYDLLDHLPELFFDTVGQPLSRARYHYCDCVTHLFVDAFSRQLGEWCARHGLLSTGHVLEEDTVSSQVAFVGSCLRFYEHMQAPGMDLLTERWRLYDTAKQVSSAARQFGRRWRLTETYGCTGWDFPLAGHKALGDWQAALGINLRCPHLSWYTMAGEAKRDYPASIFYQSPWHEHYAAVEDYFARLQVILSRGQEVRDLLVIHPNESMWTLVRRGWQDDAAVRELDTMLIGLRDTLLTNHVDFDYGDEELLSRRGRVSRQGSEPALLLAKARYRAVLVPPLHTIRGTTLRLLERFRRGGGLVVFAGDPPSAVDAVPSTAAREFAAQCPCAPPHGRRLLQALEWTARRLSITNAAGRPLPSVLYQLRENRQATYLFICNTGHRAAQLKPQLLDPTRAVERGVALPDVRIRGLSAAAQPLELDPRTGDSFTAEATRDGQAWEIRTSLPALGSRLFMLPRRKTGLRAAPRPRLANLRTTTLRQCDWPIRLSEPNVLVLDCPRYRIGRGRWQGPDEILRIDRAVRTALGVPPRGGEMQQPWARPPVIDERRIAVELRYDIRVETPPVGPLHLGLERPDTFSVVLNGQPISPDTDAGWWCDRSLRLLPIDSALLRVGGNELTLRCQYSEAHCGLEIVYLLGAFGTRVRGSDVTMTQLPTTLRLGDWVSQGLAFYSGAVCYTARPRVPLQRGQHLFVEVPDYRGSAVRILVDGQPAGLIAWEPNEVDLTPLVGRERFELGIEVISHRRNSHGPLHHAEKWPIWTGPHQFTTSGEQWTDDYQLVPCGLMAAPRLILRR